MRRHHKRVLALLAAAPLALSGCITIPTVADRVVELVTTEAVSDTVHAYGNTNTIVNTGGLDVNSIDVVPILADAGIDASELSSITVANLAYRVVTPDTVASRHLSGTITVSAGGGPSTDLVNPFEVDAGAVTGWITVPMQHAGITQMNHLLAELLAVVKAGGGTVPNGILLYSVSGTSSPASTTTDFRYELRLTVNISGNVRTKVLTGR